MRLHTSAPPVSHAVRFFIAALSVAVATSVAAPAPAQAAGACGDRSLNSIKRYYPTKAGRIPLRCGFQNHAKNKEFGVRHLEARGRYNVWHQGMIGATLATLASIEREGTTFVYRSKYFTDCDPVYRYKVIVQTKRIGGTKLMRGVITAYKERRS